MVGEGLAKINNIEKLRDSAKITFYKEENAVDEIHILILIKKSFIKFTNECKDQRKAKELFEEQSGITQKKSKVNFLTNAPVKPIR